MQKILLLVVILGLLLLGGGYADYRVYLAVKAKLLPEEHKLFDRSKAGA